MRSGSLGHARDRALAASDERRSYPLNGTRNTTGVTTIGLLTVFLMVVLRVAIGWHFFYEGLWKFQHPTQFALESEGFLGAARGPLAPYYNRLVPDIDGRRRLVFNLAPPPDSTTRRLVLSWDAMRAKFVDYFRPASDSKYVELHKKLETESRKLLDRHVSALEQSLKDLEPQITAHFDSLQRFTDSESTDPSTAFQKQRRWDEMQDLRKEAKGWVAEIDARESAFKKELFDLVVKPSTGLEATYKDAWTMREADRKKLIEKADSEDGKKKLAEEAKKDPAPEPVTDFSPLAELKAQNGLFEPLGPEQWNRLQWMSFALMCTLLGGGLCMMLGLFTRPAALILAGFLVFVVMAQPSFPGVYPIDPPQLGHSLFIDKNYIEMIALLVLASSAVGRWAGLDYFIGRFFIDPFMKRER